jgi:hypothetical protein
VACGRIRGMLGDCPINFLMGDQMHKQRAQPTPLDDKNCVHREQCPQDKLVFPHIALSSKNFRLAILTSLVRQYTVTQSQSSCSCVLPLSTFSSSSLYPLLSHTQWNPRLPSHLQGTICFRARTRRSFHLLSSPACVPVHTQSRMNIWV